MAADADLPAAVAPVPPKPVRAAGVLCVTPTGHVLLLHRTDGQGWAFPGGHIEEEESPEDAARRELHEETAFKYEGSLTLWTRRILTVPQPIDAPVGTEADAVDFTTFLAGGDEFVPKLDDEHDAYQWVDRSFALSSSLLHPGCYIALRRFGMNELAIAESIRTGELTSPQRYANMMLVAIRITGTGAAYRPALDEFPYRRPELYLNEEFLRRCNGLPVVLEHPDTNVLDTDEFSERIVGTIFIPYLRDSEVWGIAKVFNMKVAAMLETEAMSTSPGVVCGGFRMKLGDSTVLVEAKPSLVDHIALLYTNTDGSGTGGRGVWDKAGPLNGVESVDAKSPAQWSTLDQILRTVKLNQLDRTITGV